MKIKVSANCEVLSEYAAVLTLTKTLYDQAVFSCLDRTYQMRYIHFLKNSCYTGCFFITSQIQKAKKFLLTFCLKMLINIFSSKPSGIMLIPRFYYK